MRILLLLCFFAFTTVLSAQLVGETENGLASYYSNEYQGAETAYGVVYDRNDLVAAHRLYPLNSVVRVRNANNGKSVNVRIIDKGPFIRGRIIELSERAAANLDMLGKETVPVELTLISTPDQPARTPAPEVVRTPEPTPAPPVQVETTEPAPIQADRVVVITTPEPAPATSPAPAPAPEKKPAATQTKAPAPTVEATKAVKAVAVSAGKALDQTTFAPGVYHITLTKPTGGSFGVQVGSFSDLESAMDKVTEMESKWFDNILLQRIKVGTKSSYKVVLGPFDTQKSASRYASDLKSRYKIPGFTVNLNGK